MALACATDSYRLNLLASVTERRGYVVGTWRGQTFGMSGSVVGRNDHSGLRLEAKLAGVQVDLLIVTAIDRQT